MNHDNIISKVPRISLQEATSKKSGNPYVMMTIHFANGYKLRTLINDDQKFGIKDALQTKSTNAEDKLDLVD
jgi:hypothetical protein